MPTANIMDNKPMLNILPFGMCASLANPTVAAATTAPASSDTAAPKAAPAPVAPAAAPADAAAPVAPASGAPAPTDNDLLAEFEKMLNS